MGLFRPAGSSIKLKKQPNQMFVCHFNRDNSRQFHLQNCSCSWRSQEMVIILCNLFLYKNIIIYTSTMIKLIEEIDFSKQLSEEPELRAYLNEAAKAVQKDQNDQIIKHKKPTFDQDLQNHLIVTNIPDLKGKEDKFMGFFKEKVLQKKQIGNKDGLVSVEAGFKMVGNQKVYNRTLYIIYKTASNAKKAYQKLHNFKFDKDHTFSCFTVKQFKDVDSLGGEYKIPNLISKKEKISNNVDERFRDQFIYTIKENNKTTLVVKWFDYIQRKTEDVVQGTWSNTLPNGTKAVLFSPKGSYIAICEPEGVRLLGGPNFVEKGFYKHQGVLDVAFSPNETYMVSYSITNEKTHSSFMLWAVQPQICLKQLKAQTHQTSELFQFNSDESQLAIILNNQFVFYKCETIQTLKKQFKLSEDELISDGRLIKAPNLAKLVWLPDKVTVTCICYELNPSINSHPSSKIFFYNTKTKQQRKWKAIGQNIKKAEVVVSKNADWISVSFKKIQKKNLSVSVIYIVNLLKRDIETEVVQFKENVVSISWDRQNGRFGVVYELPIPSKNEDIKFGVSFYQIQTKDKVQQAVKFADIAETPANRIVMAQNGTFFALYNITVLSSGKYKYTLGVISKEPKSKKISIEIVKKDIQIPYMSYFNMDASGRFILTGTDKTYQIWTTAGEMISRDIFSAEIYNVNFRPRLIQKLSNEEEAKLEARQKQIKKKYEEEDERRINALEYEKKKDKEQKRVNFKKYLDEKRAWFEPLRKRRDDIRGFKEDDTKIKSAIYEYQYLQKGSA